MLKNRFIFLDGIRGIAAIFVVILHSSSFWNFTELRLVHAYLAVDLFFILSGFVIANAYDEKLESGKLSLKLFIYIRLIRLYPIYLLSVLICIPALTLGIVQDVPHWVQYPNFAEGAAIIAAAAMFLPFYAPSVFALFPLNSPSWSLFFELLMNFVYGLIHPILSTRALIFIVFGASIGLCLVLKYKGSLNTGFQWEGISFIGGVIRSAYGFFLGVLLHRYHQKLNYYFGGQIFPWLGVLMIVGILASPPMGAYDELFVLLIVFLIFPIALLFASKTHDSRMGRPLLLLGSASYPIYVLHVPIKEQMTYWFGPIVYTTAPFSGIAFVLTLISLSVWIERVYDIPVRRMLANFIKDKTSPGRTLAESEHR
ncbi:MAG: acyltransferase [Candidatus Saccharibacteria bacterium]|nr:acyltransferase [Moraxellaceae bacterium]